MSLARTGTVPPALVCPAPGPSAPRPELSSAGTFADHPAAAAAGVLPPPGFVTAPCTPG